MHRLQKSTSPWDQLYKRTKKMYIFAEVQLVSICAATISILLYIGWFLEFHIHIVVLFAVAGICTIVAIFPSLFYKRIQNCCETPKLYRLPICAEAPMDYASVCNAYEIERNAFCGRQEFHNMDLRISILVQQNYDRDEMRRTIKRINQKFNHQNHIQSELPMEEAARKQRINIVVLKNSDPRIEEWVYRNSDTLLRRVEGIINVGILLDQQLLLFPAITELDTHSIKKYLKCAEFVKQYFLCQS